MSAESLAKDIRLLVLDVDGVLTNGGLYYDAEGFVTKRFHVHDGLGIKVAQEAGLGIAVISGLDSPAVGCRLKELGVTEYHPGCGDKIGCLEGIMARQGLEPRHLAFLGDDWVDAGPMGVVGLPMAVADAQPEILELAAWTTSLPGGKGAVREAIRLILASQGKLEALWGRWRGEGPSTKGTQQ
jgi:3-deoxy-D-manno-octulosonate 8-phosphate phosphatase (KDO 8-P phosphatase)